MIAIHFECETVAELHQYCTAILQGSGAAIVSPPAKPKAAPKKVEAPEKGNGEDVAEAPVADETDLRRRATKFAAKNGPGALIQMQKDAGAPNGKISEIIGNDKRMAQLGALLGEAQF